MLLFYNLSGVLNPFLGLDLTDPCPGFNYLLHFTVICHLSPDLHLTIIWSSKYTDHIAVSSLRFNSQELTEVERWPWAWKIILLVTLSHKHIPKILDFLFDCEPSLLIDFNKTHWGCRTYNLDDIITKFHPVGVVLGLDNTDGVIIPRLGHLAHSDYGVLLWVILQDVIRKIRFTLTATCNFSLKYFCVTNGTKMVQKVRFMMLLNWSCPLFVLLHA